MEPGLFGLGLGSASTVFFLHLLQIAVLLAALRYLDLYEREPVSIILALFVWGAVGAFLLSLLFNTALLQALPSDVAAVFGLALVAPVVEELAKGVAVLVALLAALLAARRSGLLSFGGVVDGIVYGAAVGWGFAFVENILYFAQVADGVDFASALEVFFLRVDFNGIGVFLHAVFTACTGAGLGLAVWSRTWLGRVGWPLAGLGAGVLLHAMWNGLVPLLLVAQFGFDTVAAAQTTGAVDAGVAPALAAAVERALSTQRLVFAAFLALMAVGYALWLRYERQILRYELAEEVDAGLLTMDEYELVPRFLRRLRRYASLYAAGRRAELRSLRQLHDRLAALAFLRWRLRRSGRDTAPAVRLRAEVAALRRYHQRLASLRSPRSGGETAGPLAAPR